MDALRRALYAQAGVWALAGIALALVPGFVLRTLFGQPPLHEDVWVRLVGIEAFGLAMVMVLVAHRITELWWWAWAFAIVTVATAGIVLLNAGFGLAPRQPALFWWVFGAVVATFAFWLLYGLFVSSREVPNP